MRREPQNEPSGNLTLRTFTAIWPYMLLVVTAIGRHVLHACPSFQTELSTHLSERNNLDTKTEARFMLSIQFSIRLTVLEMVKYREENTSEF
jgi:hypothetical protein